MSAPDPKFSDIALSIVVPVYREAESLRPLAEGLRSAIDGRVTFEIIFVNDAGAHRETFLALAEIEKSESDVRVIHLARNFGQHIAIAAGMKNAKGAHILVVDADLQYDPQECLGLYWKALNEKYDCVLSVIQNRVDSIFKRATARAFYFSMAMFGTPLRRTDLGSVFLVGSHVAEGLLRMGDRHRSTITMALWLASNVGYQVVRHLPRRHGRSGYTLTKMVWHAMNGITSFSTRPLLVCFVFSGVAALAGGYQMARAMFSQEPTRDDVWLLVSLLFCSSAILASLGIVGIYVGRILETASGRPLYYVQPGTSAKLFEE